MAAAALAARKVIDARRAKPGADRPKTKKRKLTDLLHAAGAHRKHAGSPNERLAKAIHAKRVVPGHDAVRRVK